MIEDPIVAEIHKVREKLLEECEGNFDRYLERLKSREDEDRLRVVTDVRELSRTRTPDGK